MKIELIKSQNIALLKLETNKGQIEGLPKNPRLIKDAKFEKLKKSIEDNPEMLGMREVLVYPHGSKFVIIGGNMRFQACKDLGFTEVPCKVLEKDTTAEQLRAITIKDNVGFGEHDWELLANEWDSVELEDWGLDVPNIGVELDSNEFGEDFTLPDGDKAPFQQMTFTLADEQAEQIKNAISDIKETEEYKYAETMGNENSNGNALYLIIMQWAEQRK
jgi:hypothetical protein